MYLSAGECRCSVTYGATVGLDPCNGCPANQACIVAPECAVSGRECTTTKECVTVVGSGYGCVNGRCEFTACAEPCPTQP